MNNRKSVGYRASDGVKPLAVIDIGTNSLKLLIARVGEGGELKPITEKAIITRLGRGMGQTGKLGRQEMIDTLQVLQHFKQEVQTYGVEKISLVATEAVRKARNRKTFAQMVKKQTGLELRVLSPKEEASFSYQGAISGINTICPRQIGRAGVIVIDIGGGSTELIRGRGNQSQGYQSLPIGAVNLTEKFVCSDPIRDDDYRRLCKFIEVKTSFLKGNVSVRRNTRLIGVGGAVVTLAAMDSGLSLRLVVKTIEGYRLSLRRLENILDRLRRTTLAEKKRMPGLAPGRADIILAGAMILVTLMKSLGLVKLVVSSRGMRYGCLLSQARL